MNCNVFREMLEPYLDETLEADRRTWFRDHLTACTSCRDWAVAEDPSLLFAAVPPAPVDEVRVEACAVAVTNQIRQERLAGRIRKRRSPWLAAAAAAVVLMGGGLVWRVAPKWGNEPSAPLAEAAAQDESQRTPPSVEVEMAGEDVRVYQFAADDNDTAVVFVVNPALEL